jgi:transposase
MSQKRCYKQYSKQFKTEAVTLVLDQSYSVPDTAISLGIAANMLYRWKELHHQQITGKSLVEDEREALNVCVKKIKNYALRRKY